MKLSAVLRELSNNKEFNSVNDEYDWLSEFVHHNGFSIFATQSKSAKLEKHTMTHEGIIVPAGLYVDRYEYPQERHLPIFNISLHSFAKHMQFLSKEIDNIPSSPFTTEFLLKETGNPYGVAKLDGLKINTTSRNENNTQKIGRNDKCICGSGKKYKNCCLKK